MVAVKIAGAAILSYCFGPTSVKIFLFTLMSKFLLELMSKSLRRLWHVFQERVNMEEKTAERKIVEEMAPFAEMYYKFGGEGITESATEFLKSMDVDGDGRVSLPDYLSYMDEGPLGHQEWFNALAESGGRGRDSLLGPREVRPLYYILQSGRPFCMGCKNFVGGVYFTCVNCFHGSSSSFSLCLQCYESNHFRHEHKKFMDNFALLEAKRTKSKIPALKSTTANREDSGCQGPEIIESELHRIAMVYYRSTLDDQEVQSKIKKFVKSVTSGTDRRVALHDFLEFMDKKASNNNQNFKYMNTPSFFRILDKDKKGLDLVDVRTLYYIVQSGRPFCRGCRDFLAGTFFTCVTCFEGSGQNSFCLCPSCLKDNKFSHDHQLFRDNYAMLQAPKRSKKKRTAASQVNWENDVNRPLGSIVNTLNPILRITAEIVSLSAAGGCVIM